MHSPAGAMTLFAHPGIRRSTTLIFPLVNPLVSIQPVKLTITCPVSHNMFSLTAIGVDIFINIILCITFGCKILYGQNWTPQNREKTVA